LFVLRHFLLTPFNIVSVSSQTWERNTSFMSMVRKQNACTFFAQLLHPSLLPFLFVSAPKQFVRIRLTAPPCSIFFGQTQSPLFVVEWTCHHLHSPDGWDVSLLAGRKGKGSAVSKGLGGLANGTSLRRHVARRRRQVVGASVQVATGRRGIATHVAPFHVICNAGGDSVSFAGQDATILLDGGGRRLGTKRRTRFGRVVLVVVVIIVQSLSFPSGQSRRTS
jgi:hypothetical protein